MQYLLSKDHQHHKWRLQKKWISYQDYMDAQDKEQTQYQLTPSSKWKMHRRYWKFQSQNVQIFGYVYRNANGQNHGPVWKTQSIFLSEICTVILWQDCYGTRQFEKILLKHGWEKVSKLGILFRTPWKRSVYVDDTKLVGKKPQRWPNVEDTDERSWFGRTDIIPCPCLLGCTQRKYVK